jgi:hypothetical protein
MNEAEKWYARAGRVRTLVLGERPSKRAIVDATNREVTEELKGSLRQGRCVRTPFGLFFGHVLEGGEFRNPRYGQTFRVPPRRGIFYLPSETFLRDVLSQNYVTEDDRKADLVEEGFPLPAEPPLEMSMSGLTEGIVSSLRQQGLALFPGVGEFQVRDFKGPAGVRKGIIIQFDETFRAELAEV